jgi:pimeloyl-ACP methyl ester carboxylesterase
LNVGTGKVAYDVRGEGPLVVCVPGMGDLRGEYRFLAPQLVDAGYCVATMDVRGHGETSADWPDYSVAGVGADIVALVRHLDRGPAIVVGNSMAAGASVWAAAEAPEAVSRLALVGPAVHNVPTTGLMRLLIRVLFSGIWGAYAWGWYYTTLFPTRKPQDFTVYRAALQANLREPGRTRALRQMILASGKASEERLGRVKAPVLVIMGTRDPDFKDPAAEAQWVASRLNARVEMIEGAGHYPFTEMPDKFIPLILPFLAAEAGGGTAAGAPQAVGGPEARPEEVTAPQSPVTQDGQRDA